MHPQLGNEAFKAKKSGCARILYEKAFRYSRTMSAMKVDGESIDGGSNGVEGNSIADWDGSCLAPKDYISSTARNIFKSKLKGCKGR